MDRAEAPLRAPFLALPNVIFAALCFLSRLRPRRLGLGVVLREPLRASRLRLRLRLRGIAALRGGIALPNATFVAPGLALDAFFFEASAPRDREREWTRGRDRGAGAAVRLRPRPRPPVLVPVRARPRPWPRSRPLEDAMRSTTIQMKAMRTRRTVSKPGGDRDKVEGEEAALMLEGKV